MARYQNGGHTSACDSDTFTRRSRLPTKRFGDPDDESEKESKYKRHFIAILFTVFYQFAHLNYLNLSVFRSERGGGGCDCPENQSEEEGGAKTGG